MATPEELEEFADEVDPQQLWRRTWMEERHFTPEQLKQLHIGVALRRYASHLRDLQEALKLRRGLLITPLSPSGNAVRTIETPRDHAQLRPCGYPDCMHNEDERCHQWLRGACAGPGDRHESKPN